MMTKTWPLLNTIGCRSNTCPTGGCICPTTGPVSVVDNKPPGFAPRMITLPGILQDAVLILVDRSEGTPEHWRDIANALVEHLQRRESAKWEDLRLRIAEMKVSVDEIVRLLRAESDRRDLELDRERKEAVKRLRLEERNRGRTLNIQMNQRIQRAAHRIPHRRPVGGGRGR